MKLLIFPHNEVMSRLNENPDILFLTYDGILFYESNKRKLWKSKGKIKYTLYDLIDELNWWSPIFERWIPNTSNIEITKFKITGLINELDEALDYFKITKTINFSACPHHIDQIAPYIAFNKKGIEQIFLYANVIDGNLIPVKFSEKFNRTSLIRSKLGNKINYSEQLSRFIENLEAGNKPKINTEIKSFKTNYFGVKTYLFLRSIKQLLIGKKRSSIEKSRYYFDENNFSYNENLHLIKTQKKFLKKLKEDSISRNEFELIIKDIDKPIVIFAHYQPEATTFPESNRFNNPIDIVTHLRMLGYKQNIFYKEHPASKMYIDPPSIFLTKVGLKKTKFLLNKFKELNCKVLDFKIDSSDEIYKKILPVTVSGSIAIERSLIGLKTIVLGKPYFEGLPGTINNLEVNNQIKIDLKPNKKIKIDAKNFMVNLLNQNSFINTLGVGTGFKNKDQNNDLLIKFISSI